MNRFILAVSICCFFTTLFADQGHVTRLATLPLGAEVTGLYYNDNDLFMNLQHPDKNNKSIYNKGTVGVFSNINWQGVSSSPLPQNDREKEDVLSSLGRYQTLLQTDTQEIAGIIRDPSGKKLFSSQNPDFNAFISTGKGKGYLFTNWEDRPGGMSRSYLEETNGVWETQDLMMIDFSGVNGTWVNCFGSVTPWQTPLSSEELYFDHSSGWNDPNHQDAQKIDILTNYLGSRYPNPYDYGYIIELTHVKSPRPLVKKLFAMGRFSHENSVVMPDSRTVYLSDDGDYVVFFKFIADRAADLSSGTLYAAKINQQSRAGSAVDTTNLAIEWIKLAHGNSAEIEGWIREYDGIDRSDYRSGANSYISDQEIEEWARGAAKDDRVAFLESRKAAKALGATAEFQKMEGVNINYASAFSGKVPYMYMAMSRVSKGMSDKEGDIQVEENLCGVTYEMELDEFYNVSLMTPIVSGRGYNKNNAPNECSVATVANPDNLIVLEDGTVLIGEDSGTHENNALWMWERS